MCGGYQGGHPGPHIADCLAYNHAATLGSRWTVLPSLPSGRAGGAMIHDELHNVLIFSGGAERPKAGSPYAEDYRHTWALSLDNIASGWVAKQDLPFLSNHMAFASVKDAQGRQHHMFIGGQVGENEKDGNVDENWEYIAPTDTWVEKANIPFTRGHASSSTRPYGCGFFQIAGTTNGFSNLPGWGSQSPGTIEDISFYDFTTNQWMPFGQLTNPVKNPVCVVAPSPDSQGKTWLYCETGWAGGRFSRRREIELVPY